MDIVMRILDFLLIYSCVGFIVIIYKILIDAEIKIRETDPEADNVSWFKAWFKHIPYAFTQALALWPEERVAWKKTAEAKKAKALEDWWKRYKFYQAQEKDRKFSHSSRITHCFCCKCTLNSSVDNKCWWCGWLKCKCGACKCNYKGY